MNCKNCGKVFFDDYEYCPECGQGANEKLNLKVLFNDTVGNYLSVDAKVFKSFIPLLFKPGYLAKVFVEGKRNLYLHPARFYLFVSVIFFFLYSFIDGGIDTSDNVNLTLDNEEIPIDSLANFNKNDTITLSSEFFNEKIEFSRSKMDSLVASGASIDEQIREMGYDGNGIFKKYFFQQSLMLYSKKGKGFGDTIFKTIPASMFFMLPIFAFLLNIFHRKKGPFSHHLVFSFYYFTFAFCVFTILELLSIFWDIPDLLGLLILLLIFIHLILGMTNFYAQRKRISFFKSSAVVMIFTVFVIPVTFVIAIIVSFFLY